MIEQHIYNLTNDLTQKQYQLLLEFASTYCDTFQLVVRETIGLDASAKQILKSLEPFLIKESDESEWFGTQLLDGSKAKVFIFTLTNETLTLLKSESYSLFTWIQPKLPEDITLIRRNGQPFLVSISHEADGYLLLSSQEKFLLNVEIPDLVLVSE